MPVMQRTRIPITCRKRVPGSAITVPACGIPSNDVTTGKVRTSVTIYRDSWIAEKGAAFFI
jgi:hypothetical protein